MKLALVRVLGWFFSFFSGIIMKQSFFLLALLVSFPQLSETIYTPSLPELAKYFHTSQNLMQQTLSIYFWGFALGVFFFGWLSDLVGRKKAMIVGILIYTLASASCIFVSSISLLMTARFIQAFGASVGSVITQTILRDAYSGPERARMFSKISAILAFAPALGPAIGSQLSYMFSPIANFWFLFLMGLGLLLSATKLKETLDRKNQTDLSLRSLFLRMIKDKHIWLMGAFIAAHNGIIFSLHAEAPFILVETLKMDAKNYALFGLALAIPLFGASTLNARLLRRYSPHQLNVLGALIMMLSTSLLIFILPEAQHLSLANLRAIFLISTAFTITGIGISLPNCLSMSLKNYGHSIGSAGAIFGLMYYAMIGGFLGIMGIIHDGTLWPLPIYFLLLSSGLLFGALALARKSRMSEA